MLIRNVKEKLSKNVLMLKYQKYYHNVIKYYNVQINFFFNVKGKT